MLKITLVKSVIGNTPVNRRTVAALGLRKIGKIVYKVDSPSSRGMLRNIAHLIKVEEVDAAPEKVAKKAKPVAKAAPKAKAPAKAAKPVAEKKPAAKKAAPKTEENKPVAKKAPAKKAPAKKAPAKKTDAKKPATSKKKFADIGDEKKTKKKDS